MRVYELAQELGITSRQVNAVAMRCGVPIRSAAAVVAPNAEDMIRTRHKLDLAGPPPLQRPGARTLLPGFGPVPRRRPRRDRYRGRLDELGTLVRWMLEERVLLARDRLYVRGGPYVDEVKPGRGAGAAVGVGVVRAQAGDPLADRPPQGQR